MKVILLQDVRKIGKKYEVKDVSDGHALNFLIPHGHAEVATPNAMKKLDVLKSKAATEQKIADELRAKNLKSLEGITLKLEEKVNDKGHLFAGIHKDELVKELKNQARVDVAADDIQLDKPIKDLGDHKIEVKAGDMTAHFTLSISKKD